MNPIYLAAAIAALLLFKGPAKAAATGAGSAVAVRRNPGQDYATPTGVAGDLARLVNITLKGIASPVSSTATGTVEAAREAVRSGDPYYSGQSAWFGDGLVMPVGAGGFFAGWNSPATVSVNAASASAFGAAANPYFSTADSIAASPVYSPADDLDIIRAYGF